MASLNKIFHEGDTDGSGELDMDELHALVRKHKAWLRKNHGAIGYAWICCVAGARSPEDAAHPLCGS